MPAPHVPPQVPRPAGAAQWSILPCTVSEHSTRSLPSALNRLDSALYAVSDSETDEDAILVRSAKLLDYDFPKNLLAISRAGAGVNNIPLDRCSEAGIVVFNTPGANANAVKELVLCAMLMGSRDVDGGIQWVRQQVPPAWT